MCPGLEPTPQRGGQRGVAPSWRGGVGGNSGSGQESTLSTTRRFDCSVVEPIIEQKDIEVVSAGISDFPDESVVVDGSTDLQRSKAEFVIKQSGKTWDLSKLDFEKLAAEFKEVNYKNIEIADLRAFIQKKLDEMMQQNATRDLKSKTCSEVTFVPLAQSAAAHVDSRLV